MGGGMFMALDWTFGFPMVLVMYCIFIAIALFARKRYGKKDQSDKAQGKSKITKRKSVKVAMVAMTAALYATLTFVLGPISIGISGINFRISEPVPVTVAVLFDPFTGGLGTGLGNLVSDSLFGALSWSSLLAFMDSLICRTCTGFIVRDPRKLWIFLPIMAFSAMTSATMVASIFDFEGRALFSFIWISVMAGKIISALILTPIVVNALYRLGIHYR
jgi:uncharacterized membrane protein